MLTSLLSQAISSLTFRSALDAAGPPLPRGGPMPPAVLQPISLEKVLPERLWTTAAEELFRWARAPHIPTGERVRCLMELSELGDLRLPRYLIEQLDPDAVGPWQSALLSVAEWTRVTEPADREALQHKVLQLARALRDRGGSETLWSALRRYATLTPPSQAMELLTFLRDEDVPLTRQAALQCLYTVFSVDPPEGVQESALASMQERVRALARRSLDSDSKGGASAAALAASALRADAALDDPEFANLAAAYVNRRWLLPLRSLLAGLRQLVGSWKARHPHSAALNRLREREAQLAKQIAAAEG